MCYLSWLQQTKSLRPTILKSDLYFQLNKGRALYEINHTKEIQMQKKMLANWDLSGLFSTDDMSRVYYHSKIRLGVNEVSTKHSVALGF